MVGKYFIMHGGLSEKNNVLDDAAVLNVETRKWKIIEGDGDLLRHRACH